jgi:cytochrome c
MFKQLALSVLAAGSLLTIAGAAEASKPKAPPKETPASRGEIIARENCASCHAIGVKGDGPNPKAPPFRTLSKRYKLENLEEALAEGIVVGHGEAEMPHFIFEPDDIADLIAYLKRVNK